MEYGHVYSFKENKSGFWGGFFLLNPWNALHQCIICLIREPINCDIHHQNTLPLMIHNGTWCIRGNPF